MTTTILNNGIGDTLGDELATCSPVVMSGTVYYVHSDDGDDTNDGTDRDAPKATLGSAITAASAYDWICLMSGHEETLTSVLTIAKDGLVIFGAGATRPRIVTNSSTSGIYVTADRVQIRGIDFPAATATNDQWKLQVEGDHCRVRDCTFTCGAFDTWGVLVNGAGARLRDITVTGTTEASFTAGLATISATYAHIEDAVLDHANALLGALGASTFVIERLALRDASRVTVSTGSTGLIQVTESDGHSNVLWEDPVKTWSAGFGEDPGDTLAAEGQISTTYPVYYVHSSGLDTNGGLFENRPKATVNGASGALVALGVDPGVIVLKAGHAETISGVMEVETGQIIVGGGQSGGEPAVTLTMEDTDAYIELDSYSQFRNITLVGNTLEPA